MKYFIAKKRIKINWVKYIIIILGIILFIILGNFIAKLSIRKEIDAALINNAFGIGKKNENILFKYMFGFNIYNNERNIEDDKPLVYIYNTYQTLKYKNNYYSTYSVNNYVTSASLILSEYLKKVNINSIVEQESIAGVLKKNNLEYTSIYKGSRILLEENKKNNPSLEYYFDIGLIKGSYEYTTTNINDLNYAKIEIISECSYLKNEQLAKKLDNILKKYHEISLGVITKCDNEQSIYNEDFSENLLLINVGGEYNTIDEVNNTMKLLANSIGEIINGKV